MLNWDIVGVNVRPRYSSVLSCSSVCVLRMLTRMLTGKAGLASEVREPKLDGVRKANACFVLTAVSVWYIGNKR